MLLPQNINKLKRTDFSGNFTERHICFTNEKRKQINQEMMNKVYYEKKAKNPKLVPLKLSALNYDPNSQDVTLVAGTPIIARKNDMILDVFNNETFTIKQIQHKTGIVKVADDERELEIPMMEFQNLFHPAYCITTHKSQGTTFNHPYTIHEWEKFDERLKYVALSRSTNLDYINVTRPGTSRADGYVPYVEDLFLDD
jgi:ATP-dependent exoDNAse (exonuclease V) alpha subunit